MNDIVFFDRTLAVYNMTLTVCAVVLMPYLIRWLKAQANWAEYSTSYWREKDRREKERAERGFE